MYYSRCDPVIDRDYDKVSIAADSSIYEQLDLILRCNGVVVHPM